MLCLRVYDEYIFKNMREFGREGERVCVWERRAYVLSNTEIRKRENETERQSKLARKLKGSEGTLLTKFFQSHHFAT